MTIHTGQYIECFPPLINENTRIIILGTIPGEVSLSREMYYGNENNHFWDFMYRILDSTFPRNKLVERCGYKEKHYDFLLSHRIGLWDTIMGCTREGSNDSKIKNPKFNAVAQHITGGIEIILCNGAKAHNYLKISGELKKITIPIKILGSTSTMNPNNTFRTYNEWEEELRNWR